MQQVHIKFTHNEWHTITKFIHEWLPLQDRYHVQSASIDQVCPSYCMNRETVAHFLQCPHPNCIAVWTDIHQLLQRCSWH